MGHQYTLDIVINGCVSPANPVVLAQNESFSVLIRNKTTNPCIIEMYLDNVFAKRAYVAPHWYRIIGGFRNADVAEAVILSRGSPTTEFEAEASFSPYSAILYDANCEGELDIGTDYGFVEIGREVIHVSTEAQHQIIFTSPRTSSVPGPPSFPSPEPPASAP